MGVNNGSALLEEKQQETSTDEKSVCQLLTLTSKPHCGEAAEVSATFSTPQQIKLKLSAWLDSGGGWLSQYRQLAHYFSLLCFLLIIITLLQTLCLVQITLVFQSQSTLQETKLRDLTHSLEKLNQSYNLLFSQYPALNQYCPVSNSTTSERVCSPCPAGWTPQGEKCFLFSQDRADWISSQYHCMALGGAVVTVRTEEEQVFLWKKARSLSQGDSYWLGLRSSGGDGGWQWSDGSPVEQGPGFWEREPDKTDSSELCGRLTPGDTYTRSWFTYRCSNLLRRICERRQASLQ
ncbi:C-type lectin domain family 6 member A-like isoform X1 [Epinephelus fuscoguttatus]|uniref:C-type lectin domain family 6 member A-like isoform X1 n=1 Tax=Epinephelus fuscoguttatus TaxID=293821 RepID=UPI0020D14174|nr:C-type lectin domain family 6 member A-like isoform X1 [Epinephelus fuscoguttatus]